MIPSQIKKGESDFEKIYSFSSIKEFHDYIKQFDPRYEYVVY
mgnify:CR=1 FL=1